MSLRHTLRAATGSHPGQIRVINQDSVMAFIRPVEMGDPMGLFIVADGMGGHKAGEVASQLAVKTIRKALSWMLDDGEEESTLFSPTIGQEMVDGDLSSFLRTRLQVAIEEANRIIFDYARENPVDAGNLGCTVTCAMVVDNWAAIANVGDSRTYCLRDGELTQLTDDHSYVWQLAQEGHLLLEEIYDHPQRNVITRALGNRAEVPIDAISYELEPGDRLLLCSDGVWEMIRNPEEIRELLASDELESAVNGLIEAANKYGGTDNIGVVIAEFAGEEEDS